MIMNSYIQNLDHYLYICIFFYSLHPYIFFNHDRVSMTFMGFYIDRDGSLRDPSTQDVIEPNIMNRHLRQALQANGVELSKDFDKLPR